MLVCKGSTAPPPATLRFSMASVTSSTFYGTPMSLAFQGSGNSTAISQCRPYHHNLQVVCQHSALDLPEQRTGKVPRRSLAVATVLAVLMESCSIREAHAAARRKTVEADEKKKSQEDKDLSGYDAKLLAAYRRKEAMKEALAKQRAKSKPIPAATAPAAVKPEPLLKPEPEAPAASVASSAPEAVKEVVKSIVPAAE